MSTSAPASPSTTSIAFATAIVAAALGYLLGQGSSLGFFGGSKKEQQSWPNSYDVNVQYDSSDEELMAHLKGQDEDEDSSDEDGAELNDYKGYTEECKLVLVVRTDLGMGKGKIAAQCSHATLACYIHFQSQNPKSPILRRWQSLGQAKVAVQCKNEEELLTLQAQAMSLGLCARIVRDAGRTQIARGSATVLGVGPGPKSVVDMVTGTLKLL